ncbi:hypothetical protein ACFYRN_10435 [Streptomyces sp. NPDC005227]|uniref:hypothetical protein n=1 Tax=Streptomyces sp. NPDC005227 TaxID=3364707 RepID=UPI0036CF7889
MRHESTPGRRGALLGASAAVLCLGGVLAACGSGGAGGGYVAVGPGGGSPGASGAAVAPSGDVSLVPLDGSGRPGSGSRGAKSGGGHAGSDMGGSTSAGGGPGSASGDGAEGPGDEKNAGGATAGGGDDGSGGTGAGTGGAGSGSSSGSDSGRTGGGSGGSPGNGAGHTSVPATPEPSASARPAALGVTGTTRAGTGRRWCEKVTVSFRNTGGTAVRSGTVTFGTHIIGSLGIDWATITSTEALPAPIGAGARKDGTWTVCVDAWRVPLGMHIETRDVSVQWK